MTVEEGAKHLHFHNRKAQSHLWLLVDMGMLDDGSEPRWENETVMLKRWKGMLFTVVNRDQILQKKTWNYWLRPRTHHRVCSQTWSPTNEIRRIFLETMELDHPLWSLASIFLKMWKERKLPFSNEHVSVCVHLPCTYFTPRTSESKRVMKINLP